MRHTCEPASHGVKAAAQPCHARPLALTIHDPQSKICNSPPLRLFHATPPGRFGLPAPAVHDRTNAANVVVASAGRGWKPIMKHPADFADAHRRHWDDAEMLFGHGRWANADQLYGFSAECGLKAVMRLLGMPVDHEGTPRESKHRKHVRDLWPEFVTFATSRGGARYLALLPYREPFADWSEQNRYASRQHFHRAEVSPHRAAAQKILAMVACATEEHPP